MIVLPVRGSLIVLANSKEDEPVAITCTSGILSTINLSVTPIFCILWASSITKSLYHDNISLSVCNEGLVNICLDCGSSPVTYQVWSWSCMIPFTRVVLPTCLGPYTIMIFHLPIACCTCDCMVLIIIFIFSI